MSFLWSVKKLLLNLSMFLIYCNKYFLLLPVDVPLNFSYNIFICPFVNHFFNIFFKNSYLEPMYKFKEPVDFSIKMLE